MATRAVLAPSERIKIVFGRGSAPNPLEELTSLLQLYVVKQIFKISASEYLKYTRKYAILTLNNQKISGEGHSLLPDPTPADPTALGASIFRLYWHFFLSTSSPGTK